VGVLSPTSLKKVGIGYIEFLKQLFKEIFIRLNTTLDQIDLTSMASPEFQHIEILAEDFYSD